MKPSSNFSATTNETKKGSNSKDFNSPKPSDILMPPFQFREGKFFELTIICKKKIVKLSEEMV